MNNDTYKSLPNTTGLKYMELSRTAATGNGCGSLYGSWKHTQDLYLFVRYVFALVLPVFVASLVLSLHFFSAFHSFFTFIVCAFVPYVHYTP